MPRMISKSFGASAYTASFSHIVKFFVGSDKGRKQFRRAWPDVARQALLLGLFILN